MHIREAAGVFWLHYQQTMKRNLLVTLGQNVSSGRAERKKLRHHVQLPDASINQLQAMQMHARQQNKGNGVNDRSRAY